jgi:hypothetical protein
VNDDLMDFLKILVGCQNRKPVLHGAGGNPDIVGDTFSFVSWGKPARRYPDEAGSLSESRINRTLLGNKLVERGGFFFRPSSSKKI